MGKNRPKGGLLGGFDQLRAPDAPTISVTAGDTQLSVAFTNPLDVGGGAISSYTATAIASGVSTGATSSSSPVTITGLTNGTSYSVTGLANNAFGSSPYSAATSGTPALQRGLFAGGYTSAGSGVTDTINYITITTTSNTTDFGDLSVARYGHSALASGTRGVFVGGDEGGSIIDKMEYVTIASTGNTTDFGDLSVARWLGSATSNSTRGLTFPGQVATGTGYVDVIDYVTIASVSYTHLTLPTICSV